VAIFLRTRGGTDHRTIMKISARKGPRSRRSFLEYGKLMKTIAKKVLSPGQYRSTVASMYKKTCPEALRISASNTDGIAMTGRTKKINRPGGKETVTIRPKEFETGNKKATIGRSRYYCTRLPKFNGTENQSHEAGYCSINIRYKDVLWPGSEVLGNIFQSQRP